MPLTLKIRECLIEKTVIAEYVDSNHKVCGRLILRLEELVQHSRALGKKKGGGGE